MADFIFSFFFFRDEGEIDKIRGNSKQMKGDGFIPELDGHDILSPDPTVVIVSQVGSVRFPISLRLTQRSQSNTSSLWPLTPIPSPSATSQSRHGRCFCFFIPLSPPPFPESPQLHPTSRPPSPVGVRPEETGLARPPWEAGEGHHQGGGGGDAREGRHVPGREVD